MASIFDVLTGLANKGNEAVQSNKGQSIIADVAKLTAEKKKKVIADKAKVQAAIDASIKQAKVQPSVLSQAPSAPIDTGLTDLAQKAQSYPQLEGLLPSNKPVSVQNEETKNMIQDLFSRIKNPVVDMGASALSNLNPIASFLNKTNVPFLKNIADYVGNKDKISGALSGAITGAIEQPVSNLFDSMQALRKKQEARTNTTMGDRINDLLSSGTMTAGAAISALPIAAQYNAVIGGLKGNEQTKGLGEGIDAATMAIPNVIGSGINKIPGLNEEQKGALSMLANLGLVTAGGKVGKGIGERIDAGNLGRAASVVGKELTGNKATMFSGIDPTPFLKGVKEFAKNPVVQALDPTGIAGGIGNTNGIKQDPLIEEAKKYKSADEFVKAQGVTVYHGTNNSFSNFELLYPRDALGNFKGAYFVDNIQEAKDYGKNIKEVIVNFRNPLVGNPYEEFAKSKGLDFEKNRFNIKKADVESWIKENGFDGIIRPAGSNYNLDGAEYIALNNDVIKTKQQLTDIYNKAHNENTKTAYEETTPIEKMNSDNKQREQRPKYNVSLYVKHKGDNKYRIANKDGLLAKNKLSASLISPDDYIKFRDFISQHKNEINGAEFQIREHGTNKVYYNSSKDIQNKAESMPNKEVKSEKNDTKNAEDTFYNNNRKPNKKQFTNNDFNPEQYVKEQIAKREQAKKSDVPSMKDRIMNTWSDIKTKLVDSTAPIEDILYRVKNKNKDNFSLLPSKDIHNQIDRVLRTTDIAGQFMKDNGLDSIIRGVDNLDNLDQYLIAKHGQTLTKNGVETGRDPIKDASLVDSFAPKYEAQAQKVTTYSRKLLDYAVDTGIVSKETAQALKEKYPDYVPFNRVFNDDGTFNSIGGKSVANLSKQSVIQKIVGSKREVESPLQSLLQKTHEVFTQGEKNKAGKMLAEYISLPNNPFQLKQIKEVKDASDGMGTVSFYKDGVKHIYETSPEIAQAAKSLGVQQLNILGKIFAAPVRIARIGITGLNIPFIGANIVKDNVSAFINSKNSLRTSVANPKVFIQSLLEAVGHGKLYQEMVGEGGGGTSFNMSRSNASKTLEQIRAGRNIGSQIKYTITHPSQLVKAVEDIIARGEEFTRISQYKGTKDAMIAKGMSAKEARIEAARQARDTTVNFARKGEWGTVLNSAFMFLNANIQGTRTLMRRLKEDPVSTSAKIATVGLLPMAITTAWNLEDDKKKQVYDDIADYEKENNFIIIPENATKDEKGKWNVIKIPLSPDIKNLLNISRRLVEQAHGKDPVAFGEFAKSLLSTVSPIGLDQQSLISTLTPQAIKPTIEAIQNKSLFTGFPIVPRSLEGKLPEDQVKDNTSGLARILGKQIGQSPIQVEQFIKSTLGGVGSQATNAVDTVLNKAGIIPRTQIGGQGILEGILGRFMKAQGGNIENQQWEKEAQNKQLLLKNKIELTPERKAEVASFDQRKQQAKLERDRNTLLEIQKLAKDGTEEEAKKAILNEYPRLSPAAVSKIIKDTREGKIY